MSSSRRPLSPVELKEADSKRKLAWWVGLGLVFVFVVASLLFVSWKANPPLGADLCPEGRAPVEEVIILLDATDSWGVVQQTVIAQEFRRIQRNSSRFARLSLFPIASGQGALPEPAVQLCNPGRPEDFQGPVLGQAWAAVVGNPEQIQARWDTSFVEQMESIYSQEAEGQGAPRSLLMESLRGAAIQVFGSADELSSVRKRVILFSDLLQNSPLYSHYEKQHWSAEDGRALGDVSGLGTSYLDGAEVEAYLLDRPLVGSSDGHSRRALVAFWDAYFLAQGARLVRVKRLEG